MVSTEGEGHSEFPIHGKLKCQQQFYTLQARFVGQPNGLVPGHEAYGVATILAGEAVGTTRLVRLVAQ
jgi:hypothetical protein